MKKTLIIGYGNLDRQDDGVAWHVLSAIASRYGYTDFEDEQEHLTEGQYPHLLFDLQLMPEMAETIRDYERVLFVDAHTGTIEQEIAWTPLSSIYKPSAFTHHMSAETCLSLAETIYNARPAAWLLSVRGYSFEFDHRLSPRTAALTEAAVDKALTWLEA